MELRLWSAFQKLVATTGLVVDSKIISAIHPFEISKASGVRHCSSSTCAMQFINQFERATKHTNMIRELAE